MCRKEGLSQQSVEQANWLMQQLMKEIPRAVDIIEALKAAGEGVSDDSCLPDILPLFMVYICIFTFLVGINSFPHTKHIDRFGAQSPE